MQHHHDPIAATRSVIAGHLATYYHSLAEPPVRLANIVRALHGIERMGERERELGGATEALSGQSQLGGYVFPWAALGGSRTLTTAPGSKGGYLQSIEVGAMVDALRNDVAVIAAGAQTYDMLTGGALVLPRVATRGTATWIDGRGAAPAADADPVLGSVSLTPRLVLAKISVSVQLLMSPAAESFLRRILPVEVSAALDKAAVQGTGGVQPLGIVNTPNVATVSGTSLTYANICAQLEVLQNAGARPEDLFVLLGPTAARVLSTRERAAGSGFILDDGRIASVPAFVTPNVPASTMIVGTRQQLAVGSWGPGIRLEVSQSSGFNTAHVDIRAMLEADVAVLQPSGFIVFPVVS